MPLIRIELSIQPDFRWNEKVHGAAQTFHVLVEDVDGESGEGEGHGWGRDGRAGAGKRA